MMTDSEIAFTYIYTHQNYFNCMQPDSNKKWLRLAENACIMYNKKLMYTTMDNNILW